MRNYLSLIVIFILCFLPTHQIFAVETVPVTENQTTTNSTSTTTSSTYVPNPGSRHGTPCGNTICLPNETCTTYPGKTTPQCVPNPIPTNPTDFDSCGTNTGEYPPNINCWNEVTNTQIDLSSYEKSCIYEPIINYTDKRSYFNDYINCGPDSLSGKGKDKEECKIYVLANTDVKAATLGSYGPDETTINQSVDYRSQNYLYNALFDRPTDFTNTDDNDNVSDNKNREAYQSYWRIMLGKNQANLTSYILNMAKKGNINDIEFSYTNQAGSKNTVKYTDLYNKLDGQYTLFWHWPFVRKGCLVSYPVCPEFAQAIEDLNPDSPFLLKIIDLFVDQGIAQSVISLAKNFAKSRTDEMSMYAAITPLDFDSARGYITLNGLPEDGKDPFKQFELKTVSRENLPYINAISLGLTSPKYGLLFTLQPQWVVEKFSTPGAEILSDFSYGNDPEKDFPEVALYQKGFIETFRDEYYKLQDDIENDGIINGVLGYLGDTISDFFTELFDDKALKIGYTPLNSNELSQIPRGEVVSQYENMTCPLPVSYHLLSPLTAPQSDTLDDHHQVVLIKGNEIQWNFTPEPVPLEPSCSTDTYGNQTCTQPACPTGPEYLEKDGQCLKKAWTVGAIKHGKSLTVLNNPKQTDIQKAIVSDPQISLYNSLLPEDSIDVIEAKIDAQIAKNSTQGTIYSGSGEVTNLTEPIIRVSNYAQDAIHALKSCWTVPKELQNSPACLVVPSVTPITCNNDLQAKITSSITCKTKGNSLNLPQLLLDTIQSAGSYYNVPPSLIVGLLYGEGVFNPGSKFLDENYVNENLICGTIDGCNPNASYVNTLVPAFPQYAWSNLQDASKILDNSRTPNICNGLDMIFAIAKDASINQNGNSNFTGKSCFGIPLNSGGGGSSSCNWDESDIETAIRVWELGSAWSDTNQSCLTKENSCLTGGGFSAQCPTGGDTCETKSNRYSNPSHNACLYDKAINY